MANRTLVFLASVIVAVALAPKNAATAAPPPPDLSGSLEYQQPDGQQSFEGYAEEATELHSNGANAESSVDRRKAFRDLAKLWPNATVPYFLNDTLDRVSKTARQLVKDAIVHWENQTCLRFVPYNPDLHTDYIAFQKGDWCNSQLGRQGGSQPLNLAAPCVKFGTVVHEIGHSLGWIHEQGRPDRDDYIDINWKRVQESDMRNFDKYNDTVIDTHSLPYDYGSIMHYSGLTGIIKALDTKKQLIMGQRTKLSYYDVQLANVMYNCAARNNCNESAIDCSGDGYIGPACTCLCPDGVRPCSAATKRGP